MRSCPPTVSSVVRVRRVALLVYFLHLTFVQVSHLFTGGEIYQNRLRNLVRRNRFRETCLLTRL